MTKIDIYSGFLGAGKTTLIRKMIAEALNNVAKNYVSYVGNPKLMNNVMADIEIMIPVSSLEQEKVSNLFAVLDNLITLHQRRLDNLTKYKKGLLQQLFI